MGRANRRTRLSATTPPRTCTVPDGAIADETVAGLVHLRRVSHLAIQARQRQRQAHHVIHVINSVAINTTRTITSGRRGSSGSKYPSPNESTKQTMSSTPNNASRQHHHLCLSSEVSDPESGSVGAFGSGFGEV